VALLTILLCITAGAIESVLFVSEEDDANGPLGTNTKIPDDLRRRHGDGYSGAIVNGPRSEVPGIQMSTNRDDVIRLFLAADLGIDIVGGQVSGGDILQIEKEAQGCDLPRFTTRLGGDPANQIGIGC
jgi:hypothetical protein